MEVISKGVLLPRIAIEKYFDDVGSLCPNHILLFYDKVPRNLVEEMGNVTSSEMFPMAFEVKLANDKNKTAIPIESESARTKEKKTKQSLERAQYLITSQMIPLSKLVAIHVHTPSQKEELQSLTFSDVPSGILQIEISPQIFQGEELRRDSLKLRGKQTQSRLLSKQEYRNLDSAVGAAVAMGAVLPAEYGWLEAYRSCFCPREVVCINHVESGSNVLGPALRILLRTILDSNIVVPTSQDYRAVLLQAILISIRTLSPEHGWPTSSIILHIKSLIEQSSLDAVDKQKCIELANHWQDVIDNVDDPGDFENDEKIIEQSILLTLLQPDIQKARRKERRSLQVSAGVVSLRNAILGAFFGFGRLPSEMKSPLQRYNCLSELTASYHNLLLSGMKQRKSISDVKQLILETNIKGAINGIGTVSIDGLPILERDLAPNDQMMELYYAARNVGFDFEYDFKNRRFICTVSLQSDRTQKVYLAEGSPLSNGLKTIRVTSPCWRPKGSFSRSFKLGHAIDLLARNNNPDVHCRFAIDMAIGAVIVEVDQLFETMDPAELKSHIVHVAQMADSYEEQVSKSDTF